MDDDLPTLVTAHLTRHFPSHKPTVTAAILDAQTHKVLTLATGNKLNPRATPHQIKDMHAEILCKRALKYLLLQHTQHGTGPKIENVILYISKPPCGKAAEKNLEMKKKREDRLFERYKSYEELVNDYPIYAEHTYAKQLFAEAPLAQKKTFARDAILDKKAGRADSPACDSKSCTTKVIGFGKEGIQGKKLKDVVGKISIRAIHLQQGDATYLQHQLPDVTVTTYDEDVSEPEVRSNPESFVWILGHGIEVLDGRGRKRGGGISRMCKAFMNKAIQVDHTAVL